MEFTIQYTDVHQQNQSAEYQKTSSYGGIEVAFIIQLIFCKWSILWLSMSLCKFNSDNENINMVVDTQIQPSHVTKNFYNLYVKSDLGGRLSFSHNFLMRCYQEKMIIALEPRNWTCESQFNYQQNLIIFRGEISGLRFSRSQI